MLQGHQAMHFREVLLLFLAVSCKADEQFTCQRTSTSPTVFQVKEERELQQGPPGKRGANGAMGSPGQKGDKRDPGIPDNSELQRFREEIMELIENRTRGTSALPIKNITSALKYGFIILEDGWVAPFNGYQYKFVSSQQNWVESRRICQTWGGDLAATGMQDMGIQNIVMRALNLGASRLWIGLSDIETEGQWKWVNGTLAAAATIIWQDGQPNGGELHDCAYIIWEGRPFYPSSYDQACSDDYVALCEKEIE